MSILPNLIPPFYKTSLGPICSGKLGKHSLPFRPLCILRGTGFLTVLQGMAYGSNTISYRFSSACSLNSDSSVNINKLHLALCRGTGMTAPRAEIFLSQAETPKTKPYTYLRAVFQELNAPQYDQQDCLQLGNCL